MATLTRKLQPFRQVGGSNSKIGSNKKSRNNEDPEKESWKEPEKEKLS
jgi:hypothetical protein